MNFNEKCQQFGIGNTPLVKWEKIKTANIFAKHEQCNATGSIKARPALAMVLDAMENGLTAGGTIIEATSGNTGIALAYIASKLDLKCVITMPETMTVERRQMIANYGGEVVLTDGALGMKGAIAKSIEINNSNENSLIVGQFENMANVKSHKLTTAKEIIEQCPNIDVFVAGVGTGGTISGIGAELKKYNSNIEVIAVEPATSAVLSGNPVGKHGIQGIGAGFVPAIFDKSVVDRIVTVTTEDAIATAQQLHQNNWNVGISSGANMFACFELANCEKYKGKNIVTVCPDSSDRYDSVFKKQ